jgi:hypothetical protein
MRDMHSFTWNMARSFEKLGKFDMHTVGSEISRKKEKPGK